MHLLFRLPGVLAQSFLSSQFCPLVTASDFSIACQAAGSNGSQDVNMFASEDDEQALQALSRKQGIGFVNLATGPRVHFPPVDLNSF